MAILPKQIISFFLLKNGTPATGLTPTIRIWEVTPTTNNLVIGGGSPEAFISTVGDGFYKYYFTTYDSTKKYAYRIDGEGGVGAPNLGTGRYISGTNESFLDDIADAVWTTPTGSPATSTYGQLINLIGASTLGSPQTTLTVSSIVSGVWSELLTGSPQPYPVGSAGGLLTLISQTSGLTVQQVKDAVWATSGSEYPVGSPTTMGGLQNTAATASGLTPTQVRDAVWLANPNLYPVGSPATMGSQLNLTTENSISILAFTEELLDYSKNKTFLDKVAKTLTVYADDQVTPIRIFSLRDSTNTPSITEIVYRVPIGPGSPV